MLFKIRELALLRLIVNRESRIRLSLICARAPAQTSAHVHILVCCCYWQKASNLSPLLLALVFVLLVVVLVLVLLRVLVLPLAWVLLRWLLKMLPLLLLLPHVALRVSGGTPSGGP